MSSKIKEALDKKFQENDVIFWYDEHDELKESFDKLHISGVQKCHVQDNQFEIKYKLTSKNENEKFLVYFNTPKPKPNENWLLDLELAYHVFHTDQEAIILQDLGLDFGFKKLVEEHIAFFKSKERQDNLKELLGKGDSHKDVRYKMIAVAFNTEYVNLNTFIHAHGTAFANGNEKLQRDLERFELTDFYWKEISEKFNYDSDTPSIYDFLVEAFMDNFQNNGKSKLSKETRLLLSLWKDTITYRDGFNKISLQISDDLQIESKLNQLSLEMVVNDELFKLTDNKILHDLVQRLLNSEISDDTLQVFIKQRENKFWYSKFESYYQSISFASKLKNQIISLSVNFKSFEDGLRLYTTKLYRVDFLYRKFILNFRKTNQDNVLSELAKSIDKLYSNDWLLNQNDNWQKVIDSTEIWPTKENFCQRRFFDQHIRPFTEKNQRVFVVISDALRYECGTELNQLLTKENRYDSEIDGLVSSLPSYTQLGMASLLPHDTLSMKKGSDQVLVNDMSSVGVVARSKILSANTGARATAILAEDFMKFSVHGDGREFVKNYDVIYIYHNVIDDTGDDTTSQDRIFDAVEGELSFLMELLKKIANMNGNNMIVTSDHGFLYQYEELEDSDFTNAEVQGDVDKQNRRFVIGKNITGNASVKTFTYQQLGLTGEGNILIPKSINRLRVKGAGSKFIHGGASLQEIVVPVIKVNKKRKDTTTQVEIDIIKSTDKITTNLLPVSFIQTLATNKTRIARRIRASIMAADGTVLSDQFSYNFDSKEDSQRQREVKHRFQLLSLASGKYKNQRVKLVLEEPMDRANKWKAYKEYYYTLSISFTNDFDEI
ncbi:BREX-1 system phosphatase PglZ type A [Flagellimonas alvinocaridis]|uniref:BREX-1 system phosphatase PglZ type A n=1 Tax=Flagellimonas alvinocaridis TaxID=2530200 RepID=A0A4S8RUE9_9FLAO|nr:BREX-1 system phosphatase PglZ type A [Allomuricauda alvinocaridis]THV60835.1 BREX-1 system phosphatase PglZ type A [Allomuricauda alvinocaridis]